MFYVSVPSGLWSLQFRAKTLANLARRVPKEYRGPRLPVFDDADRARGHVWRSRDGVAMWKAKGRRVK